MDQRTLAIDPNTNPRDLFRLVVEFPSEVLANPLLPLLALERPEVYQQIIEAAAGLSARQELGPLWAQTSQAQQRLFAIASAERVLPICEQRGAVGPTLAACLAVARDSAAGVASSKALADAHGAALALVSVPPELSPIPLPASDMLLLAGHRAALAVCEAAAPMISLEQVLFLAGGALAFQVAAQRRAEILSNPVLLRSIQAAVEGVFYVWAVSFLRALPR